MRQYLRTDFNDYAFRPLDLLFGTKNIRITLQRVRIAWLRVKVGTLPAKPFVQTCFAATKTQLTNASERCKNPQDKKKFSHRGLAIRCAKGSERI